MNNHLKKISALIDEIDSIENADEYNLLRNQIKDELFNVFSTVSKDVFITTISIKVLKPIQEKLNVAIKFIQTKRSRSYRSKRPKIVLKRDFLIDLRNQILIDYKEQLKETELYKDFVINEANSRFLILNPTQDYPIEIFTTKQLENILNDAKKRVVSYFEKQLITKQPTYKDELFLFDSQIIKCLKEKEIEIININQRVINKEKEQKRDIENLSDDEKEYFYSHPSKRREIASLIKTDRVGFIDYLLDNETNFDISNELAMIKKHKIVLEELQNNLRKTHLFLKTYTPKKETPLTVFGDRDVNKLEQLYFELEHFLDKSTQVEDIINVFCVDYEPLQKINLQNGTLNDFAYLMDKMQPYFVVDIADRNYYNQWWADRFTFNGKEKTKNAVSTIISNTKNDASRKPQKTTRINSIVSVLK